jgi:hypothetical protein
MLNASIAGITMPPRMSRRPVSDKGFPVPWFASLRDGKWDFVNLDPRNIVEAYRRQICFLCGEKLGAFKCFVIGPMCSINRVSVEPPAHRDCAEYAVRACPFLARPNAKRNDRAHLGKPEDTPGTMVEHNPGAVLIWITKRYAPITDGRGGVLFEIGDPVEVYWYTEGRQASRAEILAAIDKGLPHLRKEAEQANALDDLQAMIDRAMTLLPVA